MKFRTLIGIDSGLRDFIKVIESRFSLTVDKTIIDKIFFDAENDQVTQKEYSIVNLDRGFFSGRLQINGTVDEYEPEEIWIEIDGASKGDVKYLDDKLST